MTNKMTAPILQYCVIMKQIASVVKRCYAEIIKHKQVMQQRHSEGAM